MNNKNTKDRVEAVLLRQSNELSTVQLAAKIRSSKTAVNNAIAALRREYGDRLVTRKHDGNAWHQIVAEAPKNLLPDLWRGWFSIQFNYQPARLGL